MHVITFRELGYKDESAHIEECRAVDLRRKLAVQKEEEKNRRVLSSMIERKLMLLDDEEFDVVSSDDEEDAVTPTSTDIAADAMNNEVMAGLADSAPSGSNSGDEEMPTSTDEVGPTTQNQKFELKEITAGFDAVIQTERKVTSLDVDVDGDAAAAAANDVDITLDIPPHELPSTKLEQSEDVVTHQMDSQTEGNEVTEKKPDGPHVNEVAVVQPESQTVEIISNESPQQQLKPKVKKNAAWLAMLEQEKKSHRRQKKSNLVVAEAEEEEEEDDIQGLEDFGFNIKKKNGDDDEGENFDGTCFNNFPFTITLSHPKD